jgi:glycosyltransferase involved in cell wall biosynthesis
MAQGPVRREARCGIIRQRVPGLLSIIVPVYNERSTIAKVVERLLTIELPTDREIIIVNDGSSDGTREALDAMPRHSAVTVVHLPQNQGKGHALRVGLAKTGGTITAIQDADLELDPSQLASLVGPILNGECDAVYGSRFLNGSQQTPFITRCGNAGLTWITNILYGQSLTDMETCYKIMRGDVARSLRLTANRFDIEPEITIQLLKGGHRIVERPVQFRPRTRTTGKKLRWRDGIHAVRMLLKHRFLP